MKVTFTRVNTERGVDIEAKLVFRAIASLPYSEINKAEFDIEGETERKLIRVLSIGIIGDIEHTINKLEYELLSLDVIGITSYEYCNIIKSKLADAHSEIQKYKELR